MIPDAALNHLLHVSVVRLHFCPAVFSFPFQTLGPSLVILWFAALSSALVVAHLRRVAGPSVVVLNDNDPSASTIPVSPCSLMPAFHPFLPLGIQDHTRVSFGSKAATSGLSAYGQKRPSHHDPNCELIPPKQ